jgi:hypothetical protein
MAFAGACRWPENFSDGIFQAPAKSGIDKRVDNFFINTG